MHLICPSFMLNFAYCFRVVTFNYKKYILLKFNIFSINFSFAFLLICKIVMHI